MRHPPPVRRLLAAAVLLLGSAGPAGCGAGGRAPASSVPFVAEFPADLPGHGGTPQETPPPDPPRPPLFDPDAYVHHRTVPLGAFPSDVVRWGDTVFTTDGDEITTEGACVVALDVGGSAPRDSARFAPVRVRDADLRDSAGNAASLASPIGFGFFLNDLEIADDRLGFVLVNAAGSDASPTLSNLVAFDPVAGTVLQVVNLAHPCPFVAGRTDSQGGPLPAGGFVQSGAEAARYVATSASGGRLYVAMSNLVFGPPSYGSVKYPGTVQVFDVVLGSAVPVRARPAPPLATETLDVQGYNPVAVDALQPASDGSGPAPAPRLLVTVAGTTAWDPMRGLVPATDAHVEVYETADHSWLGTFRLGKVGLSGTRPALGTDRAGHRVGFFPSAVTGEVYLVRLDGLFAPTVDASAVAVLRGPHNGIPVASSRAGGPGGNVTGVGLSGDGRTLVAAGFGDLFALPEPLPGRLYLLALPDDVVTGAGFGADFVPGATLHGTAPGRTLGALAIDPGQGARPDVYVAVSSPFDLSTYYASGPASLGTLETWGFLR